MGDKRLLLSGTNSTKKFCGKCFNITVGEISITETSYEFKCKSCGWITGAIEGQGGKATAYLINHTGL